MSTRLPVFLSLALLACLCLPSCNQDPLEADHEITVIGTLTDEGVECRAMRDDAGTLYTLTGDIGGYEDGERVCVKGSLPDVSYCMQGITIGIAWIGPASDCD